MIKQKAEAFSKVEQDWTRFKIPGIGIERTPYYKFFWNQKKNILGEDR
jgi:hypothetical protein